MTTFVLMRGDNFITGRVVFKYDHKVSQLVRPPHWSNLRSALETSAHVSEAREFKTEDEVISFVDKWQDLGSRHLTRVEL